MDDNSANEEQLAEASRLRVSQFSGNVLFVRCAAEKLDQVKQFGGKLKVEKSGSICRGPWIFGSKKEAQFALTNIGSKDETTGVLVQEYSPVADEACFTKLRVAGIPSSGSILDVAKLAPKASNITIRTATDSLSADDNGKVAVVSFDNKDECIETFKQHESSKIKGHQVCVFFERKKGGKPKKRPKGATSSATDKTGSENRVVGFGAKGKGRGVRKAKIDQ